MQRTLPRSPSPPLSFFLPDQGDMVVTRAPGGGRWVGSNPHSPAIPAWADTRSVVEDSNEQRCGEGFNVWQFKSFQQMFFSTARGIWRIHEDTRSLTLRWSPTVWRCLQTRERTELDAEASGCSKKTTKRNHLL